MRLCRDVVCHTVAGTHAGTYVPRLILGCLHFGVVCYVRPRLVNGVIHESAVNTNGDDIPDYDNLGDDDDDDDDDDDEIQFSDRFGVYSCCLGQQKVLVILWRLLVLQSSTPVHM